MRLLTRTWQIATLFAGMLVAAQVPAATEPVHGIAMHGAPALAEGFSHFPFANPDAPKGGTITFGVVGTFDSLNPLIIKGTGARGLRDSEFGNNVFESLLIRSHDEPFTLYGLLADKVDMPEDRSSVTFFLNKNARFSDGDRVDVDDVIFSFEVLRDHGRPNHRSYYAQVGAVERIEPNGIRFVFKDDVEDRELPLILGLMPILPAHHFTKETFEETTLDPVVGTGPYVIARVEAGERLILKRNPDYWGKDLAVKRGFDNFDEIRLEYFRDEVTLFESFKKGLVDVLHESDPARWASAYDFPALADGRVLRRSFVSGQPKGMFGFIFNTRRPIFADIRVREALGHLLDFEWINANLYHGLFARTSSYFEGSELSASGKPASNLERALLAPFPESVRTDFLEGKWQPPKTDGSGRDRAGMRIAVDMLKQAGWTISGRSLTDKDGASLTFEILVVSPDQERIALAYQRTLARIGIDARVRLVDSAQYQRRLQTYDYDMILNTWRASLSPGNEQSFRWSTASADRDGTFNFAGAKDPAIDALIDAMLAAGTRAEFVDTVRAFDRVLMSGFYVVPLFHTPDIWVALWARIKHPEKPSLYGHRYNTWWLEDSD